MKWQVVFGRSHKSCIWYAMRRIPFTSVSAFGKFGSKGRWQDATFVDIDGINVLNISEMYKKKTFSVKHTFNKPGSLFIRLKPFGS